jgi:uncharacterized protein YndB with AHSA1/START domain
MTWRIVIFMIIGAHTRLRLSRTNKLENSVYSCMSCNRNAMRASTRNSRFIKAPPEALYRAFTDPVALAVWQAPGDMTGKIHSFDCRVGGGYQMSLFYPSSEKVSRGKTAEREDRFTTRFVELTPPRRIVEAITFDSADPAFSGEMTMEVTLEAEDGGTTVSIVFRNIPSGIRPEDNETGTRLSLEKLAHYVEQGTSI